MSSHIPVSGPVPVAEDHRRPASDIHHPRRYNVGKVECIDGMDAVAATWMTRQGALLAADQARAAVAAVNVIRYVWRAPLKAGLRDLEGALWYLIRLIRAVQPDWQPDDEMKRYIAGEE